MRLVKLAPSQRVEGRWLLHLEDGSILRVGEGEVVSFALYAGMELSGETLAALREAAAFAALREKALNTLSLRPLSRRELLQKLTARPRKKPGEEDSPPPPDPRQAEAVADWLEELGYLNDGEYAKAVARHYAAKGYGVRKLKDELFRRGVDRSLWEEALEEVEDPAEQIDKLIAKKMRGENPKDRKALKRTADALARRGYGWEDIREGLLRYGAEDDT